MVSSSNTVRASSTNACLHLAQRAFRPTADRLTRYFWEQDGHRTTMTDSGIGVTSVSGDQMCHSRSLGRITLACGPRCRATVIGCVGEPHAERQRCLFILPRAMMAVDQFPRNSPTRGV